MKETLAGIGRSTFDYIAEAGGVFRLITGTAYWSVAAPIRKGKYLDRGNVRSQLFISGIESIPIVALLTFTVGMILAMQSAYQLGKLSAEVYVPDLLGVTFSREMGPLMAGLILTARVGSSIAAELGTMVVAEEVDAFRSMALNPVRFLVAPRILGMLIMLPAVTVMADVMGIIGGMSIGVILLGQTPSLFWHRALDAMVMKDLVTGISKSVIFALLISGIACYQGLGVTGGAEGVGKATTKSVVHGVVAIIFADALFTAVFYIAFP